MSQNQKITRNLEGALIDLDISEADEICRNTIRRVVQQLAKVEKILSVLYQNNQNNTNKMAHTIATVLAKNGQKFYDALLNVDGQKGREQWSIRLEKIKPI